MIRSLKPGLKTEHFNLQTNRKVQNLFTKISTVDRKHIATAISRKIKIDDAPLTLSQLLQSNDLADAFEEATGQIEKKAWNLDERAASAFMKLCLWEENHKNLLDFDDPKTNFAKTYEYLTIADATYKEQWLIEVCSWLRSQSLETLKVSARPFRNNEWEASIVKQGHDFFANEQYFEALELPLEHIHYFPEGNILSALCLLARFHPELLAEFLSKIRDPVIWNVLGIMMEKYPYPITISRKLSSYNHPLVALMGLEVGIKALNNFAQRYDSYISKGSPNALAITKRRESTLTNAYEILWASLSKSGSITSILEWLKIPTIFQLGTFGSIQSSRFLAIGLKVFEHEGAKWLTLHPSAIDILLDVNFDIDRNTELATTWLGHFLKVSPITSPSLGEKILNRLSDVYKKRILDEKTRYRCNITYNYQAKEVNGWIHFFYGASIALGWEQVWDRFSNLLTPVRNELRSFWKPSSKKFGTQSALAYSVLVILCARASDKENPIQSSQLETILAPLSESKINFNACANVWGHLLTILIPFSSEPCVLHLVENVVLCEGIQPAIIDAVPEHFFQKHPHLLAHAKQLLIEYKEYYPEEMDRLNQSFVKKDLL